MKRQIEFPITARVIVISADQHVPMIEVAAKAALAIEQLVNSRGNIRIHVSLDKDTVPRDVYKACHLPHRFGDDVYELIEQGLRQIKPQALRFDDPMADISLHIIVQRKRAFSRETELMLVITTEEHDKGPNLPTRKPKSHWWEHLWPGDTLAEA